MDGVGLVIRRTAIRIMAPVVFLAAVTVVVLLVRSGIHRTSTAAAPTTSVPRRAVARFTPPGRRLYYRLQPGDTLDVIAIRFKTTVHRLLLFNPGIQPNALAPGQKIRVR